VRNSFSHLLLNESTAAGTLHVVVGEQWVPCTGVPHDANAPYSEMTAAPHVGAAAQHHSGETVDAAGCVYWTEYTAQGPVQWCRDVVGVFGPTGIEYSSADGETWFADSEAWLALTDEAIALLAKPTRAELRKQAKGSRGAEDQRRSGGWSKGQHGERWVRGWGEREGNASRTRGQTGAAKEEWWTRASGPAKSLAESGDSLAASATQQAGAGGAAAGRDGAPVAAEVQDDTSVWKSSVQADRARIYGAAGAVVVAQLEAQVPALCASPPCA